MSKTLLLHHFEPYWDDAMEKYNTSFEEEMEKVCDYIEFHSEIIDNVIITSFEEINFSLEYEPIIELCENLKIKITLETYAYGWNYDEIVGMEDNPKYNENTENINWCYGGRDYHCENDILIIDDWIKNLNNSGVLLAGAFEGECINDIETIFDNIGINYEKINELTVGTFCEYEFKSIPSCILEGFICDIEEIEECDIKDLVNFYNINNYQRLLKLNDTILDLRDCINNIEEENFINGKEKIVSFLEDNFENGEIIYNFILNIDENEEKFLNHKKEQYFNTYTRIIKGEYYHGTKIEEDDNFNELKTQFNDDNVCYITDSIETAKYFMNNASSEGKPIIFKANIKNTKSFIYNEFIEDELSINPENRKELYDYLKLKGYKALISEDNYKNEDGFGNDIAYFSNIKDIDKISLKTQIKRRLNKL